MKNFAIAMLLASVSTYRLRSSFADGMSDEDNIGYNPSNIQNSRATCVGAIGEIEGQNCRTNNGQMNLASVDPVLPNCIGAKNDKAGENCRSNGKQFAHPVTPLPYCTGAGGEEPNINCGPHKVYGPAAPAAPKAAPLPRPETYSPFFYLPGCDGQYNDKPGSPCSQPAAQRSQIEAQSQVDPSDRFYNPPKSTPERFQHYLPPYPEIPAGDTNVWKLQTIGGAKTDKVGTTCTACKAFNGQSGSELKSLPNCEGAAGETPGVTCTPTSTPPQAYAQLAGKPPKTGDDLVICDGTNAPCLEPNMMRDPKTRPNANSPPIAPNSTPGFELAERK